MKFGPVRANPHHVRYLTCSAQDSAQRTGVHRWSGIPRHHRPARRPFVGPQECVAAVAHATQAEPLLGVHPQQVGGPQVGSRSVGDGHDDVVLLGTCDDGLERLSHSLGGLAAPLDPELREVSPGPPGGVVLRPLLLDVSGLETLPVPEGLLRQTLIDLDAQSGQRRQRLSRVPRPNQRAVS